MEIFGLEIGSAVADGIAAHGERSYPTEACGLGLGPKGSSELVRLVPMANVQDRYHVRAPAAFPRDGRNAFRLDEIERMRILESAEADGLVERLLYHSHSDAGAYFSPEDRAMAVRDGVELLPGIVHVVVSIRGGVSSEMAAFRYEARLGLFEERRIPLGADAMPLSLPDLEMRTMEAGDSARPIPPVGRGLVPRRLCSNEREIVSRLADGRRVSIGPGPAQTLERLGRGLLSPLTGYLRAGEVASIEATGRLLSGTPWRVPILLEVAKTCAPLEPGVVVELVDGAGVVVGAMGVSDVTETRGRTRVRLGGPVYVYPSAADRFGAPEVRAEILRRGWSRVLAIPSPEARLPASVLDRFDGFLVAGRRALLPPERVLDFELAEGDGGFLDAAMAQNLGATHVFVVDASLASTIRQTLAIAPFCPASSTPEDFAW